MWLAEAVACGRDLDGLPRPRVSDAPPYDFAGMRVECFTAIDERHRHTQNCRQIVDGFVQGPAAALVICRCDEDGAFHLFGCDADWTPISDTWHRTLEDAKQQAELEYAGVSTTWVSLV